MASRRARRRQQADRFWPQSQTEPEPEPDEDCGYDDEESCALCHGDGRDPYTDYLLPCPHCQGEQCAIAQDRAQREQQQKATQ